MRLIIPKTKEFTVKKRAAAAFGLFPLVFLCLLLNGCGDLFSGIVEETPSKPDPGPGALHTTNTQPDRITLLWDAVAGADKYKVYRSVETVDHGYSFWGKSRSWSADEVLREVSAPGVSDNSIDFGKGYRYQVTAVKGNGETGRSNATIGWAHVYWPLPSFDRMQLVSILKSDSHFYLFPVSSGSSYTLQWSDKDGGNTGWAAWFSANGLFVAAFYVNDDQPIFQGAYRGMSNPPVFTADKTGDVIVEVYNYDHPDDYEYKIGFYEN
jgi:hypothetical protein